MDVYTFLLIIAFVFLAVIFPRSITSKMENMIFGKKVSETAQSETIDIARIKKSLKLLK